MQHRQHLDAPGPVGYEGVQKHARGYAHSNVVTVQQCQSTATNDVHASSVGCPSKQPLPSPLLPMTPDLRTMEIWATCGLASAIGALRSRIAVGTFPRHQRARQNLRDPPEAG